MSASTAPPPLTARKATLQDLTGLLRGQHARKVDVTAPAALIRSAGGNLVLDGTVPQLTPGGVTMTAGSYRPTEVFDEGIAGKLGVPPPTCGRCATRPVSRPLDDGGHGRYNFSYPRLSACLAS